MLKKIAFTAVLILLAFPSLIAAEESAADILSKSKYSREERAAVFEIIEAAGEEGIDESFLLPRLMEARTKRVTASRLIGALQKEVQFLVTARNLLQETRGGKKLLKAEAPLLRTANLLSWGLSENEIRNLILAARTEPEIYQSATYLFVSLADWGLQRDTALRLTAAAAESKIDPQDFPGLLDLLVRSRRNSRTPAEQSQKIIELLSSAADFSELKERIQYE